MKEAFLNRAINFVNSNQKEMSDEEKEKLSYGLEGLYINVTKLFLLNLIAFFLGIWTTFVISLILFNVLRFFGFGVHANDSKTCIVTSFILLVGIPFILDKIVLPSYIIYILCISSVILFGIYAPADTVKRPLTNAKKRLIRKIIATILAIAYSVIIILFPTVRIFFLSALMIETIMILPITYRVLKMPYRNYMKV